MVAEGKARLFMRKDGKYLVYLPLALVEDSGFPFKEWEKSDELNGGKSIRLKASFKIGVKRIVLEPFNQGGH